MTTTTFDRIATFQQQTISNKIRENNKAIRVNRCTRQNRAIRSNTTISRISGITNNYKISSLEKSQLFLKIPTNRGNNHYQSTLLLRYKILQVKRSIQPPTYTTQTTWKVRSKEDRNKNNNRNINNFKRIEDLFKDRPNLTIKIWNKWNIEGKRKSGIMPVDSRSRSDGSSKY